MVIMILAALLTMGMVSVVFIVLVLLMVTLLTITLMFVGDSRSTAGLALLHVLIGLGRPRATS